MPGNKATRQAMLEQTCDQYLPGTNTKCMRGAMANGGMVCQDSHGDLTQSATTSPVSDYDTNGNAAGIGPARPNLSTDADTKPIVPANTRFAENTVPASFNSFLNPAPGKQTLYRVSIGHGGVMCEGCHGATHAEWNADALPGGERQRLRRPVAGIFQLGQRVQNLPLHQEHEQSDHGRPERHGPRQG